MNIEKKNNLLRRIMSVMLVLVMMLSLVACVEPAPTTEPTQSMQGPTSAPTTAPTTAPTEPTNPPTEPTNPPTEPTTPPTEPTNPPTEPTEPPVDPNALVYELTQEDVDTYYTLLEECEAMAMLGEDIEAIEAAFDELDAIYEYIGTQYSISMILHYSDTKDEKLEEQYRTTMETYLEANEEYIFTCRDIYLSDSPAKDELFADWTEADIAYLLSYDEQITALRQRNEEIEIEYNAASGDKVKIPLYIEMVQNNNKIAQFYGYDNYYEYAYALVYERDYSTEELARMREYGKTYLFECLTGAYSNYYTYRDALSKNKQTKVNAFLSYDYTKVSPNYVKRYLEDVPESLKNHTNEMLTANSLFATSPNAMAGAFTTTVGDRSYCFYGPGYKSCNTIIHEAGHYYASRYMDLGSIPMDLAETHSQGNEWLFICSIADDMDADMYQTVVDYQILNNVQIIMLSMLVDEFEQIVYTTDISNYTADDFNNIMNSVIEQYCTITECRQYLTNMNQYWRAVVVDQPVYYISYGVSAVAAMDLYTMAREDYDAAMTVYQTLCEQPQEELGFLGNLEAAGLRGPFDESFYIDLLEIINNRN